ncbi:hypothetical protein [Achromobacter sp. 2789STDY5608633]|uniref:hypothetical protein n=1 Tax=Achromobacter sp. 2789STDY5608633 TaxID=1806501 RepID=UPI0012E291A0|nr:hypothetical protein [Achromobacter sp. 2789STDY5608633]
MITINMVKAADIRKAQLRHERIAALAALDVEFQRAQEAGNAELIAQIVSKKQRLRDITDDPRFASALTPGDLKAIKI